MKTVKNCGILFSTVLVLVFIFCGCIVCYAPLFQIQKRDSRNDDQWKNSISFIAVNSRSYIGSVVASTTIIGILIIDALFDVIFRIPRDGIAYIIVMLLTSFIQNVFSLTNDTLSAQWYWAGRNTRTYIAVASIYMFLFEFGGYVWSKSFIGRYTIPICGACAIFLRSNLLRMDSIYFIELVACSLCIFSLIYNTVIYYRSLLSDEQHQYHYKSIDFCCFFYIIVMIAYFLYFVIRLLMVPTVDVYNLSTFEVTLSMYLYLAFVVSIVIFNSRSKELDLLVQIKKVSEIKHSFAVHVSREIFSPIQTVQMSLSLLAYRVRTLYHAKIATLKATTGDSAQGAQTTLTLESQLSLLDEVTNEAKAACKIAIDVVNKLLEGGGSNEMEVVTVGYFLEQTLPLYMLLAKAAEVELNLRQETSVVSEVMVSIYILKMKQVVGHLINNAIKYSPRGSSIEFIASLGHRDFIKGDAFIKSSVNSSNINCVRIAIRDKGCGIPKDVQEKLFTDVNTREDPSTKNDFGLSLCYYIVKMHGGEMGVSSEGDGAGSEFWIDIPLAKKLDTIDMQKLLVSDISAKQFETSVRKDLRVLCVDANPDARKFVCRLLIAETNTIWAYPDQAEDGEEAVYCIQASMARGAPYDIVLIDQFMPKIDGPSTTQIVREAGFKGLVFGMIDDDAAKEEFIAVFKNSGANDVICKPLDVGVLRTVIGKHAEDFSPINEVQSRQRNLQQKFVIMSAYSDYLDFGFIFSTMCITIFFIFISCWDKSDSFARNSNIDSMISGDWVVHSMQFFTAVIFCFSVSLFLAVEASLNWIFDILTGGVFIFCMMIPVSILTDAIFLFSMIPYRTLQLAWSMFTLQNYMFLISTILYQLYFSRDLWGRRLAFFMVSLESVRIVTRLLAQSSAAFGFCNIVLASVSCVINSTQVVRHVLRRKRRSGPYDFCALAYSFILLYYDLISLYSLFTTPSSLVTTSSAQLSLVLILYKITDVLNVILLSRLSVIDRQKRYNVVNAKREVTRQLSQEIRTPLNIVSMGVTYLNNHVLVALDQEVENLRLYAGWKRAASGDSWSAISAALVEELKRAVIKDRIDVGELNKACMESVAVLNDLLMYERFDSGRLVLDKTPCDIVRLVRRCKQSEQVQLNFGDMLNPNESAWVIDVTRFAYALDNLVSFARDVYPRDSTLDIYVREMRGAVEVSPKSQGFSLRAVAPSNRSTSPTQSFLRIRISCSVPHNARAFLRFDEVFHSKIELEEFMRGVFDRSLRLRVSGGIVKLHGGSLDIKWAHQNSLLPASIEKDDARYLSLVLDLPSSFCQRETPSPVLNVAPPPPERDLEQGSFIGSALRSADAVVEAMRSVRVLSVLDQPPKLGRQDAHAIVSHSSLFKRSKVPGVRLLTRVLCVDDAPTSLKMLCRLLPANGICLELPQTATDGGQAVAMIKESMQRLAPYELVIMDYEMPLMDGSVAARTCRQAGFQGLIVGLTGAGLQEDIDHFISSGADEVMAKPINMDRLKVIVDIRLRT